MTFTSIKKATIMKPNIFSPPRKLSIKETFLDLADSNWTILSFIRSIA